MQLITLLNSVTDYKSFVIQQVWQENQKSDEHWIGVEIVPRKNSLGVCPKCGEKCPTYETAAEPRWFEFVPLWNIPVWFTKQPYQ